MQARSIEAELHDGYHGRVQMKFRHRLTRELEERRKTNARYSLRAFARFLEADHSTLSQILRGARPIPAVQLRRWAKKLGMEPEEAAAWIAAEHLPEPAAAERERQLRHWTSEAVAIASDPTHWHLIQLSRTPNPQPDCRRIAAQLGIATDRVNLALTRLLGLRMLTTSATGCWQDATEPRVQTERQFLRLALSRVRAQAAAYNIKLPPLRSTSHAEPSL